MISDCLVWFMDIGMDMVNGSQTKVVVTTEVIVYVIRWIVISEKKII